MSRPSRRASSEFEPTNWDQVASIRDGDTPIRRQALDELLRRYLPALRAHLIYLKRIPEHKAEDILQGFVCDKILAKNLVASADRARGKFRTLLLTALDNYVTSVQRHDRAKKRAKDRLVNLECAEELEDQKNSVSQAFDISWARQVLALSVERMKEECQRDQHPQRWMLFDLCIRGPAFDGGKPPPYDELIRRLGLRTRSEVSNRLAATKRMFQRILRQVVGQYVWGVQEVEEEIQDLFNILSRYEASSSSSTRLKTRSRAPKVEPQGIETTSATDLAQLMSLGIEGAQPQSSQELARVWQELLTQPVEVILSPKDTGDDPETDAKTQAMRVGPSGTLLHSAHPSRALLQELKDEAKTARSSSSVGSLPKPIATLLYYACIAAALARLNHRLTRMTDESLRDGLAWCVDQPWLDAQTRRLCVEAIDSLKQA